MMLDELELKERMEMRKKEMEFGEESNAESFEEELEGLLGQIEKFEEEYRD